MSALEAAKSIAESMATDITDTGSGFIASFEDKDTANAYVSAVSGLAVAAVRTDSSVTVTDP